MVQMYASIMRRKLHQGLLAKGRSSTVCTQARLRSLARFSRESVHSTYQRDSSTYHTGPSWSQKDLGSANPSLPADLRTHATLFDRLVTRGRGRRPSENPLLLEKVVPRFVLQSQLAFPNALLLTQVGSFYEAHFDHAVQLAQLLGMKLAEYRYAGDLYPLAGFPISSLTRHLKTLVKDCGRIVAIAQQFGVEGPSPNIDRRVVRVITPGTLIDEDFIQPFEPNYLLAIASDSASFGELWDLAWLDVSTGAYFRDLVSINRIRDNVARIAPKEVVLPPDSVTNNERLKRELSDTAVPVSVAKQASPTDASFPSGAFGLISSYLAETLMAASLPTMSPLMIRSKPRLELDDVALRALGIRHPSAKGESGSLVTTVARTLTRPGRRLLVERLTSPSGEIPVIERRLDLVSYFFAESHRRQDAGRALSQLGSIDYGRLLQKILLGRGDIEDLHALLSVLEVSTRLPITNLRLKALLKLEGIDSQPTDIQTHRELIAMLRATLSDEASVTASEESSAARTAFETSSVIRDGSSADVRGEKATFADPQWLLRPDHSPDVKRLHAAYAEAKLFASITSQELLSIFDPLLVKFRHSSKHGPTVVVKKSSRARETLTHAGATWVSEGKDILIASLPRWSEACGRIEYAQQEIRDHERQQIAYLLQQVINSQMSLRSLVTAIAEIDLAQSFATFADETGCVRPSLSEVSATYIQEGRHPTAEASLLGGGDLFQPNSTVMAPSNGLVQVITGPNNGGKSTYLRQVAVLHILAQAGSFVPAKAATLGLVRSLFTRIGAADDLSEGADGDSLVLLDEIGRGTAVKDGLSISVAVVQHLMRTTRCRTILATHLHDVVDLLQEESDDSGDLQFFCTMENESTGRQLRPGVNRSSLGLRIAEIAGVPKDILSRASKIRKKLDARGVFSSSALAE